MFFIPARIFLTNTFSDAVMLGEGTNMCPYL